MVFCGQCGVAIRNSLLAAGVAPKHHGDPFSYTSFHFPKGPYADTGCIENATEFCGSGETCLDARELGGGSLGGAYIGSEGAIYYPNIQNPPVIDPFTDYDWNQEEPGEDDL